MPIRQQIAVSRHPRQNGQSAAAQRFKRRVAKALDAAANAHRHIGQTVILGDQIIMDPLMEHENIAQASLMDGPIQLVIIGAAARLAFSIQPARRQHAQIRPAIVMRQLSGDRNHLINPLGKFRTMRKQHNRMPGQGSGNMLKNRRRLGVLKLIPVKAVVNRVHARAYLGRKLRHSRFIRGAGMFGRQNPLVALKQKSSLHRFRINDAPQ